ncbi:glycoside hydrolase family 3 protein [Cloacibacterium sp. TD35]|uniref:glycoside hydrolase family 3 protein n=1 Tax=Cloacibacterium sp. TD35 TaxID=2976818 RepID=UPI00237E88F3|nr:glycoside hydrolase family 3 N-terminal domain-containing protein [Cloacibacterium sp. TD35]WDT67869.1 glycoside hydrolase family 3 C-terminal domain-containing protein [Cloacibacterium sp. TD35]
MKKYLITAILAFFVGNSNAQLKKQPELGYKSVKILKIKGLQFKDLNKNGKLDQYEDWRLPYSVRAKDLVSKMTTEEKAGMMLIATTRLENDWSFEKPKTQGPIGSGFNEVDLVQDTNMFTKQKLDYPMMMAAGTTKSVEQFHMRNFILRANASTKILAEWSNNLQALCEKNGHGIPAIVTSNPRNHITKDASIGLSVGKTTFSTWPGELGLAATRDLKLIREFADIARQEWSAIGLRKGYMYMADLATEPRWQRVEGTFGEDAEWVADVSREMVLGFQGTQLNKGSVALTFKHFPGGGAAEGGQDSHFDWGKYEVFPGNMLENNIKAFKKVIDAGVSAIMPYYSAPKGTQYEAIGYAYNKPILQGILRERLGFKGIINSDTGPIEMMPWGAEHLTISQRYGKTQEAGINLYSGQADPHQLLQAIKEGYVKMNTIDASVYKILLEKFQLGLFENPYVDVTKAEKIVGNAAFQKKADLAIRKSIVLLRNQENILPLKPGTKVYYETFFKNKANPNGSKVIVPENNLWNVTFVNTPEEADVVVSWVTPGSKSLFDSDGSPLKLSLSENGVDVKHLNELYAKKPTVMVVNYTNPWVIDEVYNKDTKNVKGVLATFGATTDALFDILTGKFNPTAKMPFSTPISEEKAQNQKSDVPGYLEGPDYPLFHYKEGMSFSK